MRYLSQRFAMPNRQAMGMLTDIGREAPEMFRSGATAFFRSACEGTSCGRFPADAFATV